MWLMLLYHPFWFGYSFGNALPVAMTSILMDLLSFSMFGFTKIQIYIFMTNLILLIMSITSFLPKTIGYWICFTLMYATYLMIYSLFCYFRCFNMFSSKSFKIIAFLVNILIYFSLIANQMSTRDLFPSPLGTIIVLCIFPFQFISLFMLSMPLIIKIRRNPMYIHNIKQINIIKIAMMGLSSCSLAIPCVTFILIGSYDQNALLLEIGMGMAPYVTIFVCLFNFGLLLNKILESKIVVSGASVFKTVNNDFEILGK
eukprot:NODE_362_length_8790_cov_0.566678.p4 type:complete len:257 gc:universal NODE_362_length_8790_cov_0.566678:2741-3511(+)